MQYRSFRDGTKASLLGYGCMRIPSETINGKQVSIQKEADRLLMAAFEGGINYFDTAYPYVDGSNEAAVGRALKPVRDQVHIATKLPINMLKEKADIARIFHEQLTRLETDYIDVYLLHDMRMKYMDMFREFGGFEFLEKALADGKIRKIGFSSHDNNENFKKILDSYHWDMCQIQFNILDIDFQAGLDGLRYAGEKDIPVVIMEGLRGGDLANAPKAVQEIYDATGKGWSAPEWGFRFVANYAEVMTILSGMTTMEMLNDNLRIFDSLTPGCVSEEDAAVYDAVRETYHKLIQVPCTTCKYCQPCPKGVTIPQIFTQFNRTTMFNNTASPRRHYGEMLKSGNAADQCVRCGLCETKCPQSIAIMDELMRAHEYFTK
ncbi:MAG: aldo/keto reductase [Clostridiales bacterium]|nr:aldo/keto reductase [Clostridiales bacterium]